MGKTVPLVFAFFFCVAALPVYGANPVTLPSWPAAPGPCPDVVREDVPVEDEFETLEASGVDVRAGDEEGIFDEEEMEIVPPASWFFQFDWTLDVNYWREKCRCLAHGIANQKQEFMSKFPLSLFADSKALLAQLDGETFIGQFCGPVTIAPGVVLNLSVPDTVQTMFGMIRMVNGFLIILFGTWSLAHKFISFGGS